MGSASPLLWGHQLRHHAHMNTQLLMPPWAGGAQLQAKAQPFCLAHGLHSSKKFFPWLGCTNNAATPAIAWLHLSGGCGASARMVATPWDAPDFGKPQ